MLLWFSLSLSTFTSLVVYQGKSKSLLNTKTQPNVFTTERCYLKVCSFYNTYSIFNIRSLLCKPICFRITLCGALETLSTLYCDQLFLNVNSTAYYICKHWVCKVYRFCCFNLLKKDIHYNSCIDV